MSNETFYEFPLNAQVKTYLRLECLLQRLTANSTLSTDAQWTLYFQSLFGLCDLLSQIHVRSDLVKDLSRQRDRFKNWEQNPEVDKVYLDNLFTESFALQQQLLQAPRLAQSLRDDPFLLSFRQRFDAPAGACSFDAPHLHFWLSMPTSHLQACAMNWYEALAPLTQALNFWLRLTRQNGVMTEQVIEKGVFHQDAPEANLLQIRLSTMYNLYPMANSYKSRFSIRLLPFNETHPVADEITLSLAVH